MKRILVVDDEPDMVESLATILEMEGYEVFSAANGHEAIESARRLKPDLVILDYMMPDLDGAEVGGVLRAGEGTHGIKILMSSSLSEFLVRPHFAGYDAYARKPFEIAPTLTLIADLVKH